MAIAEHMQRNSSNEIEDFKRKAKPVCQYLHMASSNFILKQVVFGKLKPLVIPYNIFYTRLDHFHRRYVRNSRWL